MRAGFFGIDVWSDALFPLYDLVATTPPGLAIASAAAIGGTYGGLASCGRRVRSSSAISSSSETRELVCRAALLAGAAMTFFHWVLVTPLHPIVGQLALILDGQLMHWLVRELSLLGLLLSIPLTLLAGAAIAMSFVLGAVSLVIVPIGALILLPDILALICWSLVALVRGIAYVLVRHPATRIVLPALGRDHAAINAAAMSRALTTSPRSLVHPPARFISEKKRQRAEALEARLLADTRLARAVMERERAHAAMRDAQIQVAALRPRFWRWR